MPVATKKQSKNGAKAKAEGWKSKVKEAEEAFRQGKGKVAGKLKIEIPEPDIRRFRLDIVGLSPLIVHNFSQKARMQMRDLQSGKPKTKKREPRDPHAEYLASRYILGTRKGKEIHGFPAASFRKAAVASARSIDGLDMTVCRQLFWIVGEYVELKPNECHMREDVIRLQGRSADLRYRAEYPEWGCELLVDYDADATSAEQIANLLVKAGRTVGIGEMRLEKGFSFGSFTLG